MLAHHVMSSPVVSIGPELPVVDIARLLVRHRIGGVPVMAGNHLVGIVTESDLLHRYEIGTDGGLDTRSWWRRVLGADPLPAWYVKSHGSTARYVMSRNVVVVSANAPLSEIANILDTRRIGRVPVIADQRVVGIVTCADLLKRIAAKEDAPPVQQSNGDEAIRERLIAELRLQSWWNSGWSQVFVTDGVVEFKGLVENDAQKLAACVAAENIHGVKAVNDRRMLTAELPVMV
jgi:CBS domain-containing protein